MKRLISVAALFICSTTFIIAGTLKGRVTCEGRPVEGVAVSDGQYIVHTDKDGRYDFFSHKLNRFVFITTPSGYVARSTDPLRPGFWQYTNLGIKQDEIHDFELVRQDQSHYTMIFLPDMHLVGCKEREDLRRFKEICYPRICGAIEKSSVSGPVYSAHLGDFTHDLYWYENNFCESDGLRFLQNLSYPTPVYGVCGNHDNDPAITGENVDFLAAWRYCNVWGPDRYSVNIGGDHWVFLDDIVYKNIEGKGKKAPGVKGDRSYDTKLTDEQLRWLKEDLSLVKDGTRVFICCHCPFFCTARKNHDIPKEQIQAINDIARRFYGGITIYSGHIHMWNICEKKEYPNLHQYSFPAASGIMWETIKDYPLCSSDGSDAGVMKAEYSQGKPVEYEFLTYSGGEKILRVYDMNEVGKAYRNNKYCKLQHAKYPDTINYYADKKYRNYIYVNFWGTRPGDTLEVLEDGKPLVDEGRADADPTKNFAYELKYYMNNGKTHKNDSCSHMHEYRTSSAKSLITVRVKGADGSVRFEQEYRRPLPFEPWK